jgi:hypothetical protein
MFYLGEIYDSEGYTKKSITLAVNSDQPGLMVGSSVSGVGVRLFGISDNDFELLMGRVQLDTIQ